MPFFTETTFPAGLLMKSAYDLNKDSMKLMVLMRSKRG